MLDIECFTYLNRALESSISPIVVLASNRGMAAVRGTDDLIAAHGVPPDFLTRLLIIPTTPYDAAEIKQIVHIRSKTEGVVITDAAIDKIAEHGVRISLRYCLQLLTPARLVPYLSHMSRRLEITNQADNHPQHSRKGQWPQPDRRPGHCRVRRPVSRRAAQRLSAH
jgi:RuvB-like protein 1 (pontin 52)